MTDMLHGAVDLHVHSYPDLTTRSVHDLQMAHRAREAGMAGFVLKSHYVPTAERATLVNLAVPGAGAMGAIVLNHFVGGLNPLAVEAFGRSDGTVVYLPTSDAINEAGLLDAWDTSKPLPPYLQVKKDLQDRGRLGEPISLTGSDGRLVPAVHDVLDVVLEFDLVLSTGHVSPVEAVTVVNEAADRGIERILITHPESPHIGATVEQQKHMASRGALLERCFAYLQTRADEQRLFDMVRETGVENNVFSSDLGMISREDPVEGLSQFAAMASSAGFSDAELHHLFVAGPRTVCGLDS